MKTNRTPVTSSHCRPSQLFGLLVAFVASPTLADGVAETGTRPAPTRLPAVTVTTAVQQNHAMPAAAESSMDVVAGDAVITRPDTSRTDTGKWDTGTKDTGKTDTGKTDTGKTDTGKTDTGTKDTGKTDTGKTDTGTPDTNKKESATTEASKNAADERVPVRWLRSSTSTASAKVARRLIAQAAREYSVGASLSAEASAWEAIRWAAEAVDLSSRDSGSYPRSGAANGALGRLQIARQAIREARDFSGAYGSVDAQAITRMAKSHATDVLDRQPTAGLSATDAADRYLDHARVQLAPVAAQSVEAAQAMDLLAAIYLCRADSKTLPSSTALCLRRAALQGQPGNASLASRLGMHLADVGLMDEARWALEHSMSLESDPATAEALVKVLRRSGQGDEAAQYIASMQNQPLAVTSTPAKSTQPQRPQIRIPQITELSPADFAALSKPVMQGSSPAFTNKASLASAKTNISAEPVGNPITSAAEATSLIAGENQAAEMPSVMRRLVNSFKRFW